MLYITAWCKCVMCQILSISRIKFYHWRSDNVNELKFTSNKHKSDSKFLELVALCCNVRTNIDLLLYFISYSWLNTVYLMEYASPPQRIRNPLQAPQEKIYLLLVLSQYDADVVKTRLRGERNLISCEWHTHVPCKCHTTATMTSLVFMTALQMASHVMCQWWPVGWRLETARDDQRHGHTTLIHCRSSTDFSVHFNASASQTVMTSLTAN